MFGSAVFKSVRRGQARIALSSAEAGRTKLHHGSWSQAGMSTTSDATAAPAISSRMGIDRVKHLATLFL